MQNLPSKKWGFSVLLNRRDSLSYKQAMTTVLTVFVIGLAISLYQIVVDLEKEKENTDQTVTQVLSLLKASASGGRAV